MYILFVSIQIIGVALAFWALVLLLNGDTTYGQKMMSYFIFSELIQNAGYLLELTSKTPEACMVAVKIQYLGACFVMLYFSMFIFSYCSVKLPKLLFKIMAIIDVIVLFMVWTCEYHHLYYKEMTFVEDGLFPHYVFTYGVFFGVYAAVSCLLPYILAVVALIYALKRESYLRRIYHYKLFCILSVIPAISFILYAFKVIRDYDPTPPMMVFMMSTIVIFIWSRQNYDLSKGAAEAVLSTIDDCVIMLDEEQKVVSFNPATKQIFSNVTDSNIGQNVEKIEDFPKEIFDAGSKLEFELHENCYEGHIKPVSDNKGNLRGYVIIIFDVTGTYRYIGEIMDMREQAEAANRAKSDFLANMSHEIRTPMNAIVGLSELIIEESRGRKVYDFACDIKNASRNLLSLINDILDLSKVEAGKMVMIDSEYYLQSLIEQTVNMMKIAASQHGLSLKSEIDDSLPNKLYGDDGRIRQVLINILNNAVKFTKKGYVKLSVSGTVKDVETVELVFKIEDTGIGIKKENLDKIFDNFQQVDMKKNRNVEGSGLGLSISRRLISLMDGTLEVDSTYGKGTCFTIRISQKIIDARSIKEMPREHEQDSKDDVRMFTVKDYHVLIVDDNKINRKVAMGMLEPYGLKLTDADCAAKAIELVKENRYEMIFMDHMMPEMDGIEATHIIREECGENGSIPIIIALTANAMDGAKEMFVNNGFQDFLAKPVEKLKMHEILAKWIPDKRKEMGEQIVKDDLVSEDDMASVFMEGVDVRKAMEFHTGTIEDYIELLNLYYMDGIRKISYLLNLVAKENWKDYEIEVHALKSASANIGAMNLSEMARKHEDAAGSGDDFFIKEHLDEMIETYQNVLSEIKRVLEKKKYLGKKEEITEREKISEEDLVKGIREALVLSEDFKAKACAQKVDELLLYEMPENIEQLMREVQMKLKLYEDDEAEDLLKKAIERLTK